MRDLKKKISKKTCKDKFGKGWIEIWVGIITNSSYCSSILYQSGLDFVQCVENNLSHINGAYAPAATYI